MDYPECDNCGRELDADDAKEGICVCGCPIPDEVVERLQLKKPDTNTAKPERSDATPKE